MRCKLLLLNDSEKTSEFWNSNICPVLQKAWILPGLPFFYSVTLLTPPVPDCSPCNQVLVARLFLVTHFLPWSPSSENAKPWLLSITSVEKQDIKEMTKPTIWTSGWEHSCSNTALTWQGFFLPNPAAQELWIIYGLEGHTQASGFLQKTLSVASPAFPRTRCFPLYSSNCHPEFKIP